MRAVVWHFGTPDHHLTSVGRLQDSFCLLTEVSLYLPQHLLLPHALFSTQQSDQHLKSVIHSPIPICVRGLV